MDEIDAEGAFPLVADGHATRVWVDAADHEVALTVTGWLADDVGRVTCVKSAVPSDAAQLAKRMVIVGPWGTARSSTGWCGETRGGFIAAEPLESFRIVRLANPFPGLSHALVIIGSDRHVRLSVSLDGGAADLTDIQAPEFSADGGMDVLHGYGARQIPGADRAGKISRLRARLLNPGLVLDEILVRSPDFGC